MHTHVYIYRFILLMEKSAILFNVHLDGSAVLGAGPSDDTHILCGPSSSPSQTWS